MVSVTIIGYQILLERNWVVVIVKDFGHKSYADFVINFEVNFAKYDDWGLIIIDDHFYHDYSAV